jgi:secretion/DNA translocation related TadE-like protein
VTAPGRRPTPRHGSAQRGSASLLAVSFTAVLALVAVAVTTVAGAVTDRRRVASAADLAALAGAAAVQAGADGCAAAASVARRNGAVLVRCTVAGQDVTVRAERRTPPVLGLAFTVRSVARAGPERHPAPPHDCLGEVRIVVNPPDAAALPQPRQRGRQRPCRLRVLLLHG